jgi:ABC-type multidrug transport system ATPase subunit
MTVSAPESSVAASIIVVRNLVKQFGRFAALRGVSAEFAAGKFYVILGDNGAGKTTLLRALAGLAHPTRGTISILGKSRARPAARSATWRIPRCFTTR